MIVWRGLTPEGQRFYGLDFGRFAVGVLLDAKPTTDTASRDGYAWLIEIRPDSNAWTQPLYIAARWIEYQDRGPVTTDPNDAAKFTTRREAQDHIERLSLESSWHPVKHGWFS